jgi:hypothetical protein
MEPPFVVHKKSDFCNHIRKYSEWKANLMAQATRVLQIRVVSIHT